MKALIITKLIDLLAYFFPQPTQQLTPARVHHLFIESPLPCCEGRWKPDRPGLFLQSRVCALRAARTSVTWENVNNADFCPLLQGH